MPEINKLLPGRGFKAIRARLEARRGKPGSIAVKKRRWDANEVLLLKQHVKAFGPTKWTKLVALLPGRTAAAVAWH
jgi:hypothetical protein